MAGERSPGLLKKIIKSPHNKYITDELKSKMR